MEFLFRHPAPTPPASGGPRNFYQVGNLNKLKSQLYEKILKNEDRSKKVVLDKIK
jgi:hypothetical protein